MVSAEAKPGRVDGAEGAVAKEIHFHKSDLLGSVLLELGDDDALGGSWKCKRQTI